MKYIGIDGCRAGWFYVAVSQGGWEIGLLPTINELDTIYEPGSVVLIDVPIGLRSNEKNERLCDLTARKKLGHPRSSSVFPAPCRYSLKAHTYDQAQTINRKHTSRGLSKQTYNIMSKIKEVDDFLLLHKSKYLLREMHPEIAFWSLNNEQVMKFNKKKSEGYAERLTILKQHYRQSEAIIHAGLNQYFRYQVARDDIVDALVGAVMAKYHQRLHSLPENPELDEHGLAMEIVYFC
jgi:predicted RNase H-like nuclease